MANICDMIDSMNDERQVLTVDEDENYELQTVDINRTLEIFDPIEM